MTLLAPLFLLGVIAVGLPIWLHRLSSENPNREQFSSAMFLEPGEPRRVLAKKVQYLLLLALRVGLLVLLALAFARPALQGAAQALIEDTAQLHVIVMDVSASMQHGDRWERAREAALDVVDAAPSGDLLQVIAVGRGAQALGDPTLDAASVRQSINALEPEYSRTDYGELMSSVDRMLRGIELATIVHVVTDLQQSSMPTRFAELAAQTPLELQIHDVSEAGEANWAVQSIVWQAGGDQVSASLRGFGTQPVSHDAVLELNGARVAELPVIVPPDGTITVTFPAPELRAGANRLEVFLDPGDDLAADDRRFMVVKRPEPRSVLLVSADPRGRDSLFLTAALEAVSGPLTTVEPVAPAAISERNLREYAFVVAADAGVLGAAETEDLREYVAGGGALFLALGQRSGGLSIVPVTGHEYSATTQIGARSDGFTIVGAMDSGHPAMAGTEELRMAKFFRFTALTPQDGDQVMAELEQGAPLLIDHALGEGRVVLFASSLDRAWNDLPVLPVFVPLVAGVTAYLSGELTVQTEAQLGTTLSPRAVGLAGGQIFAPDGGAALGIAAAGSGNEVVLDQIGFYEVVGGGLTELVAVNLDPNESDLTPVEPNAVERWLSLNAGSVQGGGAADLELAPSEPTPLWPWVLSLLIVVVFMESWVGNWHLRVRRGIAA